MKLLLLSSALIFLNCAQEANHEDRFDRVTASQTSQNQIEGARGNEMLVNSKTGHIVIEFIDGKTKIYDRFLEVEMRETGIYIPPSKREDFDGKEVVYLSDPSFEKAFIEVYDPLCIANSVYRWQN